MTRPPELAHELAAARRHLFERRWARGPAAAEVLRLIADAEASARRGSPADAARVLFALRLVGRLSPGRQAV